MRYYLFKRNYAVEPIEKLSTGKELSINNGVRYHSHYCQECHIEFIGEWRYQYHYLEAEKDCCSSYTPFEKYKLNWDNYFNSSIAKKEIREEFEKAYNIESRVTDQYLKTGIPHVILRKNITCEFERYLNRQFCGFDETLSEFYTLPERKIITDFNEEYIEFKKMTNCPICGSELTKKLPNKDEEIKNINIETENLVTQLINNNDFCEKDYGDKIFDANNLNKYLKQLLNVETTVLEVSTRLKTLYSLHILTQQELFSAKKIHDFEIEREYQKIKEDYDNAKNVGFVASITIDDIPINIPSKPIEPKAPVEPLLKTPNIFNKNKVLAENLMLTNKYKEEVEAYNQAKSKYDTDMEEYLIRVDQLKQQQKNLFEEKVSKEKEEYLKNIEILKDKYQKAYEELETKKQNVTALPQKVKFDLIDNEKKEAIEILEKAVKLRAELYSCDIIFEKYRDIVSIATFYEYLSSGRCQELGGPDGAYNLYETEIRMNMIISQMDRVIESLEQIKQNQFVIYSALQSMNSKLSQLNESMNKAVKSIVNIEASVDSIDKTAEVIAYNTERTAYYAQKNAELTNALGYLVALS